MEFSEKSGGTEQNSVTRHRRRMKQHTDGNGMSSLRGANVVTSEYAYDDDHGWYSNGCMIAIETI